MKHDPHLIQLSHEPYARIHPLDGIRLGIKDGADVTLRSNGASIPAKIGLDESVAAHTIVLPIGFDQLPVQNLAAELINGLPIEITRSSHAV